MSFKSDILTTVIDYTALVSLLTNDDVLSLVNFLPTKPFSTTVLALAPFLQSACCPSPPAFRFCHIVYQLVVTGPFSLSLVGLQCHSP